MPTLVQISKKKPKEGLSRNALWVRRVGVAIYVIVTIGMFVHPIFPRIFWTMALPLVPLGIVVAGFYPWRKVCPLAFWGLQGSVLKQKRGDKPRRVPKWLENWYPMVTLGILYFGLNVRLVATNGDGAFLGPFLIAIGLAAAGINYYFTGKTWCNFFCPVSIVERIYTEPNSLRREDNSQCTKCTACKKNCPDIDQENGYWKDVESLPRKMAYYSFPGLVLAFYTYFWLRTGDWESYFDGRWTRMYVPRNELFFGEGFFFAPSIPAFIASPLSLAAFMATSYAIFEGVERLVGLVVKDAELRRHRTLTLAGFTAFSIFYMFAGQPTLRQIPYGQAVMAFGAPILASFFLYKRWWRERSDYMGEKSARKLLKKWKFDEPPPDDPAGVFAYFKAREQAHEEMIGVYRDAVVECQADGVVTTAELHLLETLRAQLNISDAEHRRIMNELSDEARERFASERVLSAEQQLQFDGYRDAVSEALLHGAGERQLRKIRLEYDIDRDTHEGVLAELQGDRSPLRRKATDELDRLDGVRDKLKSLAPFRNTGALDLVIFVLLRQQERIIEQVVDTLAALDKSDKIRRALSGLRDPERDRREAALRSLARISDEELVKRMFEAVLDPLPEAAAEPDKAAFEATLKDLEFSSDPYLRAGCVHAIGHLGLQGHAKAVQEGLRDEEPLVRETAVQAAVRTRGLAGIELVEPLMDDPEPTVRRVAREAVERLDDEDHPRKSNPIRVLTDGRTLPPIPDGTFSTLSTLDRILFLRCVPLFAELGPDDLQDITAFTEEREVSPPEPICLQGEATDDLYVIIDGKATVSVAGARSSLFLVDRRDAAKIATGEKEVAELGPGDVVGELAAIDRSPRSASVRPKSDKVRMLMIRGDDFRRQVAGRRDVAPRLMSTLSQRLRGTLARLR